MSSFKGKNCVILGHKNGERKETAIIGVLKGEESSQPEGHVLMAIRTRHVGNKDASRWQ